MFFANKAIALTGVLATLVLASPEPQSPAQESAYESSLVSFLQAVQTDPAVLSLASSLQKDLPALTSFEAAVSSMGDIIADGKDIPATLFGALPTAAQPIMSSIYYAEQSIASANGFGGFTDLSTASGSTRAASKTATTASETTGAASETTGAASESTSTASESTSAASESTTTAPESTTTAPESTDTATSTNGARATGHAMLGASAGAVAGFIGVVALL